MFTITSNLINTFISNYASQVEVRTGNFYRSHLATIGFGEVEVSTTPNSYGVQITMPEGTQQVATVAVNGIVLSSAINPQNPQPGEFIYNPDTNKVQITIPEGIQQVVTVAANDVILSPAINPQNPQPNEFIFNYDVPIILPESTQQVIAVAANGVILSPAVDPQNLQPNEFIFNPYTKQLFVYSNAANVQIYSTRQEIKISPQLITNLPNLFTLLPLEGDIQISRSFENHPQMSFTFETNFSKDTIISTFAPGREVNVAGVGYRVNNCNCVEMPISIYPDGRCKVSVSFGGKWENYLNNAIFLRPQCLRTDGIKNSNDSVIVPLSRMLRRANIALQGKSLKTVFIPWDSPADAVVQPDQLIQDRLRVAGTFVRYSNNRAIEIIDINGLNSHFIPEDQIDGEISTDYQAISKPSKIKLNSISFNPQQPDLNNFPNTITQLNIQLTAEARTNLGFEYPLTELTGDLKDIPRPKPEKTQGQQPRYKKRPKNRDVRIEGNVIADEYPEGVELIQVMSLCFDLGGEQETRTFVYTENGTTYETVEEIWGFAFTAAQIYDKGTGKLIGSPSEHWKLLKQVTTEYIYDVDPLDEKRGTGYLLRKIGRGFNTARWKSENAGSPETLELIGDTSTEAAKERELYSFFRIPVYENFSQVLKIMPERNSDGLYETIPDCSLNGSSVLINPNFVPPYYAEAQRTEKISFARRPNPENDGKSLEAGDIFVPDLIVGSVEIYESHITGYTPPLYEKKIIGFVDGYPVSRNGELIAPAKWFKYNKKFSASGQAIETAIEDISVEQGEGNPPLAEPKRADLFVREEPEASGEDRITFNDKDYRYFIWTDGHSRTDAISGTESFSEAKTVNEALTAVNTKLAIENWRNGYSETLTLTDYRQEIKEGDRITYFCKGQYRVRVVISVNHNLSILGNIGGQPIVVGKTSLTVGKYVTPQVQYAKVEVPPLVVLNIEPPEEIGSLLGRTNIRSRRNP
jgi:hypothetical protein